MDGLQEITVNGDLYYLASDVQDWHRDLVATAEKVDELEEQLETAKDALGDAVRMAESVSSEASRLYGLLDGAAA